METKVTKIVYNACFGGFGLSEAAMRRYAEIRGLGYGCTPGTEHWQFPYIVDLNGEKVRPDDIRRTDPALVQVVEELGERVNTRFSDLQIVDIPAGTKYRIDEYDGNESVCTIDDYDWSVA
jgi:hypothetical protein